MTEKSRTLIANLPSLIGQSVTIAGWAQTKRDHGKVTFIDLRDRSGVVQVVGFGQLKEIKVESVLEITGQVVARSAKDINQELATGKIEIQVNSYQIINQCQELPISIDTGGEEISEVVRLKYRYLDLRRSRLQKIIKMRSQLIAEIRNQLFSKDFVEIETPMLTQATKEGARDFIVPSRLQPGKFYALPQSPQQYKQLLMVAGFERYFQVARCIRDEDLRADRGFEFTQLDLELSFCSQTEIMALMEEVIKAAIKKVGGQLQQEQFPIFTYQQAMAKFGQDKFDLRTEAEKKANVLAFAWVVDFPFFKKVDQSDAAEVLDSKSGWTFTHNPFSQPQEKSVADHLAHQKIDQILAAQYDLVCNGHEVGGGSLRAYLPEVLTATYEIMGYNQEEIQASVGHMLTAFKYGTPPHGGIALGLDRLVMMLAGAESLKDTVAFPMSSTGNTAVMSAPGPVTSGQLAELEIKLAGQRAPLFDQVLNLVQENAVNYQLLTHQPILTTIEAAAARQLPIAQNLKVLVLKSADKYYLLVLAGDQKADLSAIKDQLQLGQLKLAAKEEVVTLTGAPLGATPPFGALFNWPTLIDQHLTSLPTVAFVAGRTDRSLVMSIENYLSLAKGITLAG